MHGQSRSPGSLPSVARLRGGIAAAVLGERARVLAIGIVGAAHEGTVAPELESEPPVLAGGAAAVFPAILGREQVQAESRVESIEHLLDPETLGLFHRAGEVAPEVAQHLPPVDLAGGDGIELAFERSREVVFDVAF